MKTVTTIAMIGDIVFLLWVVAYWSGAYDWVKAGLERWCKFFDNLDSYY